MKFYALKRNHPPKFDRNFTRRIERLLKFARDFVIAANLLACCACKFYPPCVCFVWRLYLCGVRRVLKTERERLKFHDAICEPYDPKDMHARIIF
ncbi:hypothetical protein [uncultured Campylobacter sp.]|uniref:hypothetical protein n=1 Tax=uncultured Campylobacter sp. TaxID=218934 RepID=UPI0026307008|nr:hypothetical protein [uncultured Campylobacter sp.]